MCLNRPSRTRDLTELVLGYALIVGIIWSPEHLQRILSPIAFVLTLLVVLVRGKSHNELGLGWRGFVSSLWIMPAAFALSAASMFLAAKVGTLHPLYKGDLQHITGYVLWTIYQQFLLQDFFMDRVLRSSSSPQSRADRRHAGVGHRLLRSLPPLSQSLDARPGAGPARPMHCDMCSGQPYSSHARWPGFFAISIYSSLNMMSLNMR
jgi:hypothetical protein